MGTGMRTKRFRIGGMTCVNCQNKIERALRNVAGIGKAEVSYTEGSAVITYDPAVVSLKTVADIIENLDYRVLDGNRPEPARNRAIGILIMVAALYMLLRQFGLAQIFTAIPLAEAGMGYGMIFVIGLVTSVHCVAMCGGINLSQCISQPDGGDGKLGALRPSFLYNMGRVASYTAVGAVVGALGSVISFSGAFRGVVQLVAGAFMVIMGLNMLDLFPWLRRLNPRMPKAFSNKIESKKTSSRSPFYIGLLNGLMPCGPLQAMQLYALSTGSAIEGAVSMMLFSVGTVPLMFGLGALSSILSKKFTRKVMTAGAVLVVVLGLTMFSQGWSLSGFAQFSLMPPIAGAQKGNPETVEIVVEDGVQVVNSTLSPRAYPAITVQAGIPVKWTIDAPEGSINGCNDRMLIPEYGIEYRFKSGENIIEFTPTKAGKFKYSCWMGMIRSSITVVENGTVVPRGTGVGQDTNTEPVVENGVQLVKSTLSPRAYPAITVRAGMPVKWTIEAPEGSINECNDRMVIPEYGIEYQFKSGENIIEFTPAKAGEFQYACSLNTIRSSIIVEDDDGASGGDDPVTKAQTTGGTRGGIPGVPVEGGVQLVKSTLLPSKYPAITVQVGIPVKWTIDAPEGSINACNDRMFIPEYDIEYEFRTGENVIEFTPTKIGKFQYTCWMGMIRSSITVVEAAAASGATGDPVAKETEPSESTGVKGSNTGMIIEDGAQIVKSTLYPSKYPAITVQVGIPVKWTINAPQGSINSCNDRMSIPEYNIEYQFRAGDNVIEFTPTKVGKFQYTCWMGMIRSYITVVEDVAESGVFGDEEGAGPVAAGVAIPSDKIILGEINNDLQQVRIKLTDDGFNPAVIILQAGVETSWIVDNDSTRAGNSSLLFPTYYTQIPLNSGENTIYLSPTDSFDFSTADAAFYGYVKVVDDLSAVDLDVVREEVENHQTMIYPSAYFEDSGSSGCCH